MAKPIYLNNFKLWATTKAEDYLLIASYLDVEPFVPASDMEFEDFTHRYFEEGKLVSDKTLIMLNQHLRRKNFAEIHFTEGHSDSYVILRGAPKSEERRVIKDQLANMSKEDRKFVLAAKREEVRRQVPRDPVYDARKAQRTHPFIVVDGQKLAGTKLAEQLHSTLPAPIAGLSVPTPEPQPLFVPVVDSLKEVVPRAARRRTLTLKGETRSLTEWSRITGISYHTMLRRMDKGLTEKEILSKTFLHKSRADGQNKARRCVKGAVKPVVAMASMPAQPEDTEVNNDPDLADLKRIIEERRNRNNPQTVCMTEHLALQDEVRMLRSEITAMKRMMVHLASA